LEHFKQQMRASAGAVFFLPGHHVTRAHCSSFVAAAVPDSYAAQCGPCETSFVVMVQKMKMGFRAGGRVVGSQSPVAELPVGVNDLPGVHFPIRVPYPFKFVEGFNQFFSKHELQKVAARLPVSVLSGERSSITDYQPGGCLRKVPVMLQSFFGNQVKPDP